MGSELFLAGAAAAFGAGAITAFGLRPRPGPALLGAAGAAILGAALLAAAQSPAAAPRLVGAAPLLLLVSVFELLLVVTLAPPGADRLSLLGSGLAGLAGLSVAVAAPDVAGVAVALLAVGVGHALLPGLRSFPARLRGPALGAALLVAGSLLLHAQLGGAAPRVGALFLAAGVVAAAGLLPFQHRYEPGEPAVASSIAWTGFVAPALIVTLIPRTYDLLEPATAPVFSAVLVGFGLLNLLIGLIGAWLAEDDSHAWQHTFLGDWGLALVGFGILVRDGRAGSYLILLAMILVRLPLYLFSRPALRGSIPKRMGASNLMIAGLLAGLAPFAGFPARLLLMQAAVHLFWPLAVLLAVALLLWLAHAFRLASTLGRPSGRAAVGVAIAVGASLLIGIWPASWLHGGAFTP